MADTWWNLLEPSLPYLVMTASQLFVAFFISLLQFVIADGVNATVLVVYEQILAAAVLSCVALLFDRGKRPPLSFSFLSWTFFVGLLQIPLGELLLTVSLRYMTATFQSMALNTIPAVVFLLAVLAGRESFGFRSLNGLAKLLGIVASCAGATILVFVSDSGISDSGSVTAGERWAGIALVGLAVLALSVSFLFVMFKRMFGSGSGGGSRSRGGGSGNSSRGHGSGYADDSRDRDQWGTAGSQEVQPDTADRLRGIPQFQTDDPATSTTAEPVYYRDFTGDIDGIPLPHAASRTSAMCERHHPIAVQRYMQLSDDVRRRVRDAKEQIARRKGDSIYEKAGRSGNRVVTKRPPSGRRIVLEWSDTPRVPIGEWATRFNNMVGCLVKRADFINPYFKFNEQPFKSFEEIWRELMKSYCLEDYPFTWDYIFGANGKVQSLLRSWRFDIKNEYYNKIEEDWERFWKLDPRINTHHFGALLMYWDDPKILDKFAKAKVNRASMEVDHFLGTQSFAQVEHKYKKKTGKPTMPVNLLIAEGYTPKAGYDKATKREKIQKWKEEVDAQMAQLLQETQSSQEGSNLDPHLLSRQQNDQIIESVFGPSKKGRRRFRGGGTWTDDSTTSSEPTMHTPSNMSQQSDNSSSVHGLLTGVIAILASRIDPALFASVVPALYADIPSQIPFAIQHIILCLANRIPNEVYVDIVTYVMSINNNQGRDTAGSTSGMHGGDNQDYDGTNDGNDDDNDEDDNDDDDDGTE